MCSIFSNQCENAGNASQSVSLPVSERLRLRELPHPVHSENLDHAVRVQSSLQATRHSLIWGGKGPAHRRHSVILAASPLSSIQLSPVNTGGDKDVTPIIQSWTASHQVRSFRSVIGIFKNREGGNSCLVEWSQKEMAATDWSLLKLWRICLCSYHVKIWRIDNLIFTHNTFRLVQITMVYSIE